MDQTDYQILNILQQNCRTTIKSLAKQLGLTAPTISERMRRLEEQGIIRSYCTEVDRKQLGYHLTGFIRVALEPEKYDCFCALCHGNPAIVCHYHIIGKFNALLYFAVRDTQELDALLSSIKQYGDSQTSVELKAYFKSKNIPASN